MPPVTNVLSVFSSCTVTKGTPSRVSRSCSHPFTVASCAIATVAVSSKSSVISFLFIDYPSVLVFNTDFLTAATPESLTPPAVFQPKALFVQPTRRYTSPPTSGWFIQKSRVFKVTDCWLPHHRNNKKVIPNGLLLCALRLWNAPKIAKKLHTEISLCAIYSHLLQKNSKRTARLPHTTLLNT